MPKSQYTAEMKIIMVKKYLTGEGSYESIANAYGIGKTSLTDWVRRYKEQGAAGLYRTTGNVHYSRELKIKCVEAVLKGEGSVDDIAVKYNISPNCNNKLSIFYVRSPST